MALKYSNVGGGQVTGFAIDTSDGSFTDVVLGSTFPSGGYQVTSVNGNQNIFVFFGAADGTPAGGTAGKSIIATKDFDKVTIINAGPNDLITFEYKETAILDSIGTSGSYSGAVITSFVPNQVSNINDTIAINGAALAEDVVVEFTGKNGVSIPAKSINRVSESQIIVTRPDTMSGDQDPYRITVQNPGIEPAVSTNILTAPLYAGSAPVWSTAATLPAFTKDQEYSVTLTAYDPDQTAISYSFVSGALPAGLSYTSASSTIAGVPTVSTSSQFTIRATEVSGRYTDRTFSLPDAYPVFTTLPTLPEYTKNTAYSTTIVATDDSGTAPSLSVVGQMPIGLTFNALTGDISGTIADSVDKTFTIRATDANGSTTDQLFSIPNIGPTWSTPAGSIGEYGVGASFTKTLVAIDDGTVEYFLVAGTLPNGLTLGQATGIISGVPTVSVAEGTVSTFTIRVIDDAGNHADREFSIVADVTPVWTTTAGALGYVTDSGNSIQLAASAGTQGQTLTYSVVSGSLPAGLSLNSSTGLISGNCTEVDGAQNTFTVRVTDNVGLFAEREFSTIKNSVPVWSTPAGTVNITTTLSASSGTTGGEITYSVVSGSLPTGVTLSSSAGTFSGNPTVNGTYNFTVRATDSLGVYADRAFSATVTDQQQTATFNYTGAVQTFVSPSTSVNFDLYGGQGGRSGGLGGRVTGTISPTLGQTYYVYVGGAGAQGAGVAGGFNGGGTAGGNRGDEGSGAGATDFRTTTSINDRVATAAGGGGSGGFSGGAGGNAGGTSGSAGTSGQGQGGSGGTASAGGNGGYPNGGSWGSNGDFGVGGAGGTSSVSGGGGGGGGYYGGGGGGADVDSCCSNAGGGGGGSSWTHASLVTSATNTGALRSGNGVATFSYTAKRF